MAATLIQDDGGPAFPVQDASVWQFHGMSLRDYFAAHASEHDVLAAGEELRQQRMRADGLGILPDGWRVTARYMYADAMLAARSRA